MQILRVRRDEYTSDPSLCQQIGATLQHLHLVTLDIGIKSVQIFDFLLAQEPIYAKMLSLDKRLSEIACDFFADEIGLSRFCILKLGLDQ